MRWKNTDLKIIGVKKLGLIQQNYYTIAKKSINKNTGKLMLGNI